MTLRYKARLAFEDFLTKFAKGYCAVEAKRFWGWGRGQSTQNARSSRDAKRTDKREQINAELVDLTKSLAHDLIKQSGQSKWVNAPRLA